MPADLNSWLDYISAQHSNEIELGLARLQQVGQRLALDGFSCPVITVAGTNGKGSSISALEKFYIAAGYRTGCYTSPHLTVFNERMRILGSNCSDQDICNAFTEIESVRDNIPLTYFEFATLAAFLIFVKARLDVVLLEVGLGGRLDATNLFPADLALITTISIDHTDWLGEDRETIAVEKAGIIHPGNMVVISDPDPAESLLSIATQKAGDMYVLNQDYSYQREQASWDWRSQQKSLLNLPLPGLKGLPQYNNLAGVLMCLLIMQDRLPVADETIIKTLPDIQLLGRFQVITGKPLVVLDVSHNPDSTALLADNLKQQFIQGKTHAIVGMLRDKDISESLANVLSNVDYWYFSGLSAARAENPEAMKAALEEISPASHCEIFPDIQQTWEHVKAEARDEDRIVVFGSFHTVGAIIDCLS